MPTRRTDLTRVPTARRKTNWRMVADGAVWEFVPGADFDSAPLTLATNARHWGSKHGYSVSVAIDDRSGHVLVQFRPIPVGAGDGGGGGGRSVGVLTGDRGSGAGAGVAAVA